MKEYMNRVSMSCETNFKKHDTHVIGVSKGRKGDRTNIYMEKKKFFFFPNLIKIINPEIKQAE